MDVRINSKMHTLASGTTLAEAITALGFRARSVAVERNGEPIARSKFGSTVLDDGDVLEVVRPVAGG